MAKGPVLKKPAASSKHEVGAVKKPAAVLKRQPSSVNVEATAVNFAEPPRRTENGLHFREVCHRLYLEWDDERQNSTSYKTMGPHGRPDFFVVMLYSMRNIKSKGIDGDSEFALCS